MLRMLHTGTVYSAGVWFGAYRRRETLTRRQDIVTPERHVGASPPSRYARLSR
jgi:hypothetical protein